MQSAAQIVATIGPSSETVEIISDMIAHRADVIRLNFSWGTLADHAVRIEHIRAAMEKNKKQIPVIQDVPGPRVQEAHGHTYDSSQIDAITEYDEQCIAFGAEKKLEYVAVSFVGSEKDILKARKIIEQNKGSQKIIAKIERKIAVEKIDEIIEVADAVMVARGDLGNEIPLEQIPFVQHMIIEKCNKAGKPVIVATEMMLSMVEKNRPTRAEVTDVANAILLGADAVMLSDETAAGKYPVDAVTMMEKIVIEAEKHIGGKKQLHVL